MNSATKVNQDTVIKLTFFPFYVPRDFSMDHLLECLHNFPAVIFQVGEIFTAAGNAFNQLGNLTAQLQAQDSLSG